MKQKTKFILSLVFGGIWLLVSFWFAIGWARDASHYLSAVYVWWVIIGIALLPGLIISTMFFSNLMNKKLIRKCRSSQATTVVVCAHNEENNIAKCIQHICKQCYYGAIRLLVVDNASRDATKRHIEDAARRFGNSNCSVEYQYCGVVGKSNALNHALQLITTPYFVTVDADTYLDKYAIQNIMDNIVFKKSACVAGNLFVYNAKKSLAAKMQNYDYLLSIAAIKRFQGSYRSTLVAQGAFSAFETAAVRWVGGWEDCLGEDIVLTYKLLESGRASTYEPLAVGYTVVPETFAGLYRQRKRWAVGMIEGFAHVKPWQQGSVYAKFFTCINLLIIYLDLAFVFGMIPGIVLAICGYNLFIGWLTLAALAVSVVLFLSMYLFQRKLKIPFRNSFLGFLCFLLFFQLIQSTAALGGYFSRLMRQKGEWK